MVDVSPPASEEPYRSLYRRYRPQRFEEVRGQEHVTRALRHAVRDDRVAHAYLFSGPRGTGKTSTARILAMALNCAAPVDGEPDGTCASCVEIRRGSSLDVHELDAASNRKLDEMRELLSRVALGTRGRWKVYIVDEVHQLTGDAASALLKTLEEPPGHVVFVLATTDPQKVLPTIRSRTQHFEFRLLGADVLGGLLRDVNERAALGLAPEAIDLVVRRGHGSARDALSVLDQVAAAGDIEDETGLVSDIVDAVADRDPARLLTAVAEAVGAGRDPRRLATDLLDHLRNGFLATQARGLVHLADDAALEVEAQARRMGLPGVVRALEAVGQAAVDMRDAVDPRVTLEVALVRLAAPQVDGSAAGLVERIEHLERQVAVLTAGGVPGGSTTPMGSASARPGPTAPAPAGSPPGSPGGPAAPSPAGASPTSPGGPAGPLRRAAPSPPAAAGAPPSSSGPPARPPAPTAAPAPGAVRPVSASPPQPRRLPSEAPSAPPASPSSRLSPGRPALGAHRRGALPGPGEAAVPANPGPGSANPGPGSANPAPGSGSPTTRPAGSETGDPGGGATPGNPLPGPAVPSVGGPGPASHGIPSRDELTKAWGDVVLPGLPPAVKAYVSSGRFIDVDGATAVYALPDEGLLRRSQPVRGAVEGALARHFGQAVPVRFVLDGDAAPVPAVPAPDESDGPDEDDPSTWHLDDLTDAGPGVVSPEQRLLEAFPGAEEVTP